MTPPSDQELLKLKQKVIDAEHHLESLKQPVDEHEPAPPGKIQLRLFANDDNLSQEELDRSREVNVAKAKLGEAKEALEVAKEKRRVSDIVRAREAEIGFLQNMKHCVLCNEPLIPGKGMEKSASYFPCCGKRCCVPCYLKRNDTLRRCPECNCQLPVSNTFAKNQIETFALNNPYFQYVLGDAYLNRRSGFPTKAGDERAMSFIRQAAEGGEPEAQALLGFLLQDPYRGFATNNLGESRRWFESAASNGHILAHANVGFAYINGQGGEINIADGLKMITFAAHHGLLSAQATLAQAFMAGTYPDVLPKSLERAKYWYGKIIHRPEAELAREQLLACCAEYGRILVIQLHYNMDGVVDIAGCCPIPEALHWFRKSESNRSIQPAQLNIMNTCMKLICRCFACSKPIEKDCPRCSRCKWARYCDRDCQREDWERGHKKDCKKVY